LCWRSWSVAVFQINRQVQKPFKRNKSQNPSIEIALKTPKEILCTLWKVSVKVSSKRKKCEKKKKVPWRCCSVTFASFNIKLYYRRIPKYKIGPKVSRLCKSPSDKRKKESSRAKLERNIS
jgi:hypothetical protein